MERLVNIYTLEHPITGEIKYVGKTIKSLQIRLSEHITDSKKYNFKNPNWIKSILKLNLKPIIQWNSFTEIQEFLNYSASHIVKCCKGKIKTSYGYVWRYK